MNTDDYEAIRAIIDRQFGSLNWTSTTPANWSAFVGDFLPGASLYPAARPANPQKPEDFVERMKGLATSKLRSFKESALGQEIRVFGNVAVAVAVCQITEHETQATRGIEMMLLVKTEGRWQIVSQAWNTESESKPIPATFSIQINQRWLLLAQSGHSNRARVCPLLDNSGQSRIGLIQTLHNQNNVPGTPI